MKYLKKYKKGLRLIRQSIFTEMESFRKKQDKQ